MLLIGSVLLQPGKTDAGALFTSNISNAAFAPRGTASVLSRITIAAATVFMLSALLISMPALQGNISVLQSAGDTPTDTAPVTEPDANANAAVPTTDANAAPVTDVKTSPQANADAPANAESNSPPNQ